MSTLNKRKLPDNPRLREEVTQALSDANLTHDGAKNMRQGPLFRALVDAGVSVKRDTIHHEYVLGVGRCEPEVVIPRPRGPEPITVVRSDQQAPKDPAHMLGAPPGSPDVEPSAIMCAPDAAHEDTRVMQRDEIDAQIAAATARHDSTLPVLIHDDDADEDLDIDADPTDDDSEEAVIVPPDLRQKLLDREAEEGNPTTARDVRMAVSVVICIVLAICLIVGAIVASQFG